jgi:hypothetical protein
MLHPNPGLRISANGVLAFLKGDCKPHHFGQILPGISDSELAENLRKDDKFPALLEIMNEGTPKIHNSIQKIQQLKPCDCA